MMERNILYYLLLKNIMPFIIGLDIFYKSKSGITYVISHNYEKINIDSYDSLLIEKTLILHNVVILVKSVFNKDKNNYYNNIFLGKCFYQ